MAKFNLIGRSSSHGVGAVLSRVIREAKRQGFHIAGGCIVNGTFTFLCDCTGCTKLFLASEPTFFCNECDQHADEVWRELNHRLTEVHILGLPKE